MKMGKSCSDETSQAALKASSVTDRFVTADAVLLANLDVTSSAA